MEICQANFHSVLRKAENYIFGIEHFLLLSFWSW